MAKQPPPAESQTALGSLRRTGESIRETFESIVVAFILAFVFRAFVIEAFVIPTGSMAATLLGEHGTMTCSDCGYEYKYGKNNREPTCPNCFWRGEPAPFSGRTLQSGDRILVLKWPLDIGGERLGPKRWEVTVFKDPSDGVTNYIKRLIGLPNEVLEIIDGDIYTVPVSELSDRTVADLDEIRHLNYLKHRIETGNSKSDFSIAQISEMRAGLLDRVHPELLAKYHIQRKTPVAQSSLWFNVYNHDFVPRRENRSFHRAPRWEPVPPEQASSWDTADRSLTFADQDAPEQFLMFVPLGDQGQITDFYAYNGSGVPSPVEVGDLRLRCVLFFDKGEGFVRFLLTKRKRGFWATLHADGRVRLEQTPSPPKGQSLDTIPADRRKLLGEAKLSALDPSRPVEVDFCNVDYRVSLRVDGRVVLASTDEQYSLDTAALASRRREPTAARALLSAKRIRVRLAHVVLERDVYYRQAPLNAEGNSINPWRGQGGWGTFGNPLYLRPWEYFMLGDNSPQSKDSRLWWEIGPHLLNREENYQVGTVPADQLIGKSFFVYWPSGYRLSPRLRVGLIPNVGAMRWIR